MLKAKLCFGLDSVLGSVLILLVGSLTPQLSAQTLNSPHYVFSDGSAAVLTATPFATGTSSQGCGTYGSCANRGCQNEVSTQSCSDDSCTSNCGCGTCGMKGGVAGHLQSSRDKRREYFQFPPAPSCPGDRLNQLIGAQKANGRLAQLVFYKFHFGFEPASNGWALSPAGVNNVHKIARIWPSTPGTIIVEPSGDANGDQIRLQIVQQSLATSGIHAEVALGKSTAFGLSGAEAMNIYEQRILNAPLASSSQSVQSSGASAGGK